MLNKIKLLLRKIKYYLSREYCYDCMEREGSAVFGMCCGMAGGDFQSGYLSYSCMDCPYFTLTEAGVKSDS